MSDLGVRGRSSFRPCGRRCGRREYAARAPRARQVFSPPQKPLDRGRGTSMDRRIIKGMTSTRTDRRHKRGRPEPEDRDPRTPGGVIFRALRMTEGQTFDRPGLEALAIAAQLEFQERAGFRLPWNYAKNGPYRACRQAG